LLVANRWTEDEVGAKDAHHVAAILPFRSRSIQQLATVRNMESFAMFCASTFCGTLAAIKHSVCEPFKKSCYADSVTKFETG
jgi:hypothetical protein